MFINEKQEYVCDYCIMDNIDFNIPALFQDYEWLDWKSYPGNGFSFQTRKDFFYENNQQKNNYKNY